MAKIKVSEELSKHLRKLGKKGAKRRMETMTPEARTAVAKKAAAKSAEVRSRRAAAKNKPASKGK
jgi:hypothetical protein